MQWPSLIFIWDEKLETLIIIYAQINVAQE
jgi:hypothetical protein